MTSKYHELNHPRKISHVEDGEIAIYGSSDGGTTWHPVNTDDEGNLNVVSGLVPPGYDYIELSYDSNNNLTGVVYKVGGVSGTLLATLVLVYDGNDNMTSVTKS